MPKVSVQVMSLMVIGMIFSGLAHAKAIDYKASVHVSPDPARDPHHVQGMVFEDLNRNGRFDREEPGIPNVMVSNGRHVVLTDDRGQYRLPARDEMTVFITKPAGYDVPVDEHNIPQFFYHHQPIGSPPEIQRFGGLPPTGPLPAFINFPLIRGEYKEKFTVVISGDTQSYSNNEVGYVRDTLAKEVAELDVEFLMIEGDVIGDDLSLLPRFKRVMSATNTPLYMVPGNHDLDFDAPGDVHAFDTFKREWGPTHYSFNIGKVHFMVLNSVEYPCNPVDEAHAFCQLPNYNGVIDRVQMEWLHNDLAYVPQDYLIVLNMHIPLVSFIDRGSVQHSVDNREEVYALLEGRKALALGGHTHTLEHFVPGEEEPGWGQPTPIPQIITGAACGSWWSGDFTDEGIPMSYQRLGAPRGYLIFAFAGNTYTERFKATGKPATHQMSIAFLSPTYLEWYNRMVAFVRDNPPPTLHTPTPPLNVNDLPDTNIVTVGEIGKTFLMVNVWNGSKNSVVTVQFDDRAPITAIRTRDANAENTIDPFATRLQLYSYRYAARSTSGNDRTQGFELFRGLRVGPAAPQPLSELMLARQSNHLWQVALPRDLGVGVHTAKVRTIDMYRQQYEETKIFEVMESRPAPFFRSELFQ